MAIALRCLAIAALGILLLPASALADADGHPGRDEAAPDDRRRLRRSDADSITISRRATEHLVTMNSRPGPLDRQRELRGAGTTQITCAPAATSIAVDMGDG